MTLERERFGAAELAICLSRYDLGDITSIKEFARGSRRAPKVVLECQRGRFLFKRRARGKDDLRKVAFAHQVQLHLAGQNFPLPRLLGTRADNNSMLLWNDLIYEMFEYLEGTNYDGSPEATFHAGKILGLYHKLLRDFQSEYAPARSSYHNSPAVSQAIGSTVQSLPLNGRPDPGVLMRAVTYLEQAYRLSAEKANQTGLPGWPVQIVHGDWHPGNMLFRDRRVVAVLDYDSARLQQRVIDLANGALQFSIIGGGEDPSAWPEYLDESRFKRFIRGYDSAFDAANVVSLAELKAVPYLMCQAMMAEAVLPIAATGSFGQMQGFPFLQMIQRKVKWLLEHAGDLEEALRE